VKGCKTKFIEPKAVRHPQGGLRGCMGLSPPVP
jgi:hypothetical protein